MKFIKDNSAILSTLLVVIFITIITISAERSHFLKEWLKITFSHHWVGKGILAIFVWVVISFIPIKLDVLKPKLILTTLALSTFALVLFYTVHYIIL